MPLIISFSTTGKGGILLYIQITICKCSLVNPNRESILHINVFRTFPMIGLKFDLFFMFPAYVLC